MPKEIIVTDKAPKPFGAYSQAVKAGGFVFVSTQGPSDAATRQLCGESIQDQTRQCLKNVEAILHAAGHSLDKVVSTTFTLAEIQDFAGMDEESGSDFPHHSARPRGFGTPDTLEGYEDGGILRSPRPENAWSLFGHWQALRGGSAALAPGRRGLPGCLHGHSKLSRASSRQPNGDGRLPRACRRSQASFCPRRGRERTANAAFAANHVHDRCDGVRVNVRAQRHVGTVVGLSRWTRGM